MGVIGLTPYLLKAFPQVVHTLPNRARELAGKTVVFDGTLLTQRFHFANNPHPYRHVIGWYKIFQELAAADVRAICVFDGFARHAAKHAETARRRESRTVQAARAAVEEERLARLQALHRLLQHAQTLEVDERARLLADFERDTSTSRRVSTVTVAVPRTTPVLPPRSRSEEISWGQYHAIERDIIDDLWGAPHARPADVKTAAPNVPELVSSPTPPVDVTSVVEEPVSPLRALGRALKQLALVPLQALTSEQPKGAQPSDLVSAFTHLFTRFQRSVPEASAAAADEAAAAATPEDAQALHTISKHQKALTDAEDAVWRTLAAEDADYAGLAADVAGLLDRSAALTESYGRRTNVPTAATYAEAREVLGALGVQCVVPAGACEAEALAAALVLHGHADYVVSEDTDVLVYEAPLVRNMTSRLGPLQLIAGADVRAALGLDRAAFVDWTLLLGTDFSQRIRNVGPARALKLIRAHGRIEHILAAEAKHPPRVPVPAYLAQVAAARAVFSALPPIPADVDLTQRPPDDARVGEVLRKYGIHAQDFDWESCDAEPIGDDYFGDGPGAGAADQDFGFVPFR